MAAITANMSMAIFELNQVVSNPNSVVTITKPLSIDTNINEDVNKSFNK